MANTTKYVIPKLDVTALVKNGPTDINAALDSIDSKMTGYSEGALASRPVSTGGSPGVAGRIYRATDTGQHFIDTGASWELLARYVTGTLALRPAAGATGRIYRATDTGQVFLDTGSGWDEMIRGNALGQYRTISEIVIAFAAGDTAGAYYAIASGGHVASGSGGGVAPRFFRLTPADYAVAGLTTQFRVAGALATNPNAPAANFTAGLNPVTFSGSLNSIAMTTAASVSGSTFTRSAPSASTGYTDASSDFSLSTPGVYTLGVTTSATLAANSLVVLALRLEVRHI